MLRIAPKITKEHYGVVARMDLAQGWWGVDNDPNIETTTGSETDETTGETTYDTDTSYNYYKLFRDKDTNYTMHVDHAYAWVTVPRSPIPITVRAGRMWYGAGHKLVLDMDYDGVQVDVKATDDILAQAFWAKISEGEGSTKNPVGLLMNDEDAYADANLWGLRGFYDTGTMKIEGFGLYYLDRSGTGDSAYLPNGYGYLNARFRPQITSATVLGLSVDGKATVLEGLTYSAEANYLFGRDEIDNTTHEGGAIDINDGSLSGWNAYAKADLAFTAGLPLTAGLTLGLGSGDDDVTSGRGNINKIQTAGFFPLTNVWEDSVMPDVGGISPQGLGSPVSRGYREFENTMAVQGRVGITPYTGVNLSVSYTYLRSLQTIYAFDADGTPSSTQGSNSIGQEIDANLSVKIWKGFGYKCLFGVFFPDNGAGYLINGNTDTLSPAWEVKQVVTAKF